MSQNVTPRPGTRQYNVKRHKTMLGKIDNIVKIQNNTIRDKTSLWHRNQCCIIIYQHNKTQTTL